MTSLPRAPALLALGASALGAVALPGCDFADPTPVINPNLTEQAVLDTDRPLRGWVQGLERQLAVSFANYITEAEIASDNYQNTNTYFDQELDLLDLTYTNQNTEDTFFAFADLRESARFGREVVAPADEDATDGEIAETYFFEAVARAMIGQAFAAAPLVPAGPLRPPRPTTSARRSAPSTRPSASRPTPTAGPGTCSSRPASTTPSARPRPPPPRPTRP